MQITNPEDTIVAIATPPGRGGIGVVRLAGPEARAIAAPMLHRRGAERSLSAEDFAPGEAHLAQLIERINESADLQSSTDHSGQLSEIGASDQAFRRIDEVVVTYFPKPHSYTTDDIVEISAHGSPVVLHHIVEMAVSRGARIAEPGEFTMRAFLNGRLDLTQAEAVRDLIESQTLYQAQVAAQQLEGALTHRLQPIKLELVDLIAVLEAGIDFAEDDVPVASAQQVRARIADIRGPLQGLADSFAYGRLVHEGLTLAIVGRPNVGKSSLFNRLVERERAIVTPTPGTTRDLVSETVAIGGIPVRLVDTAGIRTAQDEAESIGIRKSREALADADLVLVVVDASQPLAHEDEDLIAEAEQRRAILVANKSDLGTALNGRFEIRNSNLPIVRAGGETCMASTAPASSTFTSNPYNTTQAPGSEWVFTSALNGDGIPELRSEILRRIGGQYTGYLETGFLTNVRHQSLVRDSLSSLDNAAHAASDSLPHEMLLLDLYGALRPLDEITGATTADDILNKIFSSFCIGK